MKPKISIIIPVYKAEKTIDKCVESVLNQTFSDWELLLIEDGSPDNSGKRCDYWAEKDSRILSFHQDNQGPGAARNLGLDMANGLYVNFVDSDDWLSPHFLEHYMELAGKYDIVFSGCIKEYDNDKQLKSIPYKSSTDKEKLPILLKYLLKEDFFGYTYSKQLKKEIIDKYNIRFDTEIFYREDAVFTAEYMKHVQTLAIADNADYHYYMCNEHSLLHTYFNTEEYIKVNKILYEKLSCFRADSIFCKYIDTWEAQMLYYGCRAAYRNNVKNDFPDNLRKQLVTEVINFTKLHTYAKIRYSSNILKNVFLTIVWKTKKDIFINKVMYIILF